MIVFETVPRPNTLCNQQVHHIAPRPEGFSGLAICECGKVGQYVPNIPESKPPATGPVGRCICEDERPEWTRANINDFSGFVLCRPCNKWINPPVDHPEMINRLARVK